MDFTVSHIGVLMATRQFQVMLEWDDEVQVWVTYVPSLNFLSTYGATREDALAQTREAIAGYFEAAAKEGVSVLADDGG
jgi:predicted RNase H-like HicB family nuclease